MHEWQLPCALWICFMAGSMAGAKGKDYNSLLRFLNLEQLPCHVGEDISV